MYFTIVPQHVVRNKKLGEARFLYGHILTLSNRLGYCYASNNFLADIMECTPTTISRYVSTLVKAKIITVAYAKNSSRTITPIDTFIGNKLLKTQKIKVLDALSPEMEAELDVLWQSMKVGGPKK
jgi:hypothetical protein